MADVEAFLTRKVGPLPVWAYAAGGGVLVSLILLYRRGAAGSPGMTGDTGSQTGPFAPAPIVVTPTTAPLPDTSSSPVAAAVATVKKGVITGAQTGVFQTASSYPNGMITVLKGGTEVELDGPPVQGASWGGSNFWQPIKFGGQTAYVHSQLIDIQPGQNGGMGGSGTSSVSLLAGGGQVTRFLAPHRLPQYVAAPGGLGGVAARTGVPLIRLQSLNRGRMYPGGGGDPNTALIA